MSQQKVVAGVLTCFTSFAAITYLCKLANPPLARGVTCTNHCFTFLFSRSAVASMSEPSEFGKAAAKETSADQRKLKPRLTKHPSGAYVPYEGYNKQLQKHTA